MDETLEKLTMLVQKELDKIVAKGDITPIELDNATKAVCLIEKLKMLEGEDLGSSYNGMYMGSYRRGRSNTNSSYGNYDYSMDHGYSGHSVRDRMISHLESTMMDNAQSESERRTIESLISQLSSNNR